MGTSNIIKNLLVSFAITGSAVTGIVVSYDMIQKEKQIQVPGGVSVSSYALSSADVPRLSPTSSRGTIVSRRTSGGGGSAMPTVSTMSRTSVAPVAAGRASVATATPVGTSSSLAQGTFAGRTSSVAAASGGGGGGAMMAMGQASRMAAGSKAEVSAGGGVISEPFADTRPGTTVRPRVNLGGDTGDPGNQVPLSDSWLWAVCAVAYFLVSYYYKQHKSNTQKQQE